MRLYANRGFFSYVAFRTQNLTCSPALCSVNYRPLAKRPQTWMAAIRGWREISREWDRTSNSRRGMLPRQHFNGSNYLHVKG